MKKTLFLISILCTAVMGVTVTRNISLNTFNAGELSPLMNSRVEFPKYRSGAKTLQNMIVRTQGPISRRPGTKYIATVKDADDETRVISFPYSTTLNYIVELGDEYARFYRAGAQIVGTYSAWITSTDYVIGDLVTNSGSYYRCLISHTSGTFATDLSAGKWETTDGAADLAYEIVTPWDESDVFGLHYAMAPGTMRIVHPDYEPYKLTRTAHNAWTCTAIGSTTGPFVKENTDDTWTLTPDGTTSSIGIVSSKDLFNSGHEGARFQISQVLQATTVSGIFIAKDGATQNSASLTVLRYMYVDVTTGSIWKGDLLVQRSYDSGSNWSTVFPITRNNDGNVQFTFQETDQDALYRVRIENFEDFGSGSGVLDVPGLSVLSYTLTARLFTRNGVVEITTVTDSKNVIADVIYTLGSTDATWHWAESAWSDGRGWPRTVEYHERRILYGGSATYPETIWASIIAEEDPDYDDFTMNTQSDWSGNLGGPDDIAWISKLAGSGSIQWLKSREYLMVGTTLGVGKLGQPGKPITQAFSPIFRMQPSHGAAAIQPIAAADAVLYVERGAKKVRELTYTFATERYTAPDMTVLSEHITGGGIVDIAFQYRPDPVLWCVRSDGQLLSFAYNRKEDVLAWGRNTTGATGLFKSVASHIGSNEDEVWHVVGRTLTSGAVKYIELSQVWDWGTDQNDCYFVDSGTDDITALDHLEGETVALWADGRPIGEFTVALGEISPSGSYTHTTVGLPIESVYETMPIVLSSQYGPIMAEYTNIMNLRVKFIDTLGCHVGPDASNLVDLEFSDDDFATTLDVVTDIFDFPYVWGSPRAPTIYFYESTPVPLTIEAIHIRAIATIND